MKIFPFFSLKKMILCLFLMGITPFGQAMQPQDPALQAAAQKTFAFKIIHKLDEILGKFGLSIAPTPLPKGALIPAEAYSHFRRDFAAMAEYYPELGGEIPSREQLVEGMRALASAATLNRTSYFECSNLRGKLILVVIKILFLCASYYGMSCLADLTEVCFAEIASLLTTMLPECASIIAEYSTYIIPLILASASYGLSKFTSFLANLAQKLPGKKGVVLRFLLRIVSSLSSFIAMQSIMMGIMKIPGVQSVQEYLFGTIGSLVTDRCNALYLPQSNSGRNLYMMQGAIAALFASNNEVAFTPRWEALCTMNDAMIRFGQVSQQCSNFGIRVAYVSMGLIMSFLVQAISSRNNEGTGGDELLPPWLDRGIELIFKVLWALRNFPQKLLSVYFCPGGGTGTHFEACLTQPQTAERGLRLLELDVDASQDPKKMIRHWMKFTHPDNPKVGSREDVGARLSALHGFLNEVLNSFGKKRSV